jgi:hypothetical protein
VVIGTEVSIGMVGGVVGDSTVELSVMERLLETVGATVVKEDSILRAELEPLLVEGAEVVSVLVDDSTLVVAGEDVSATSLLVSTADDEVSVVEDVSAVGVGVDAG